ncbi:MAG: hypothetical protein LBU85_02195 [Treponema sp.]|jgi:p-aminobenzoyl-glutamate transporter AbgT|nr:hypothetical protein [Treponema sp.]
MKRNFLLVVCILIIFCFVSTGCSTETENGTKRYSYEIYTMSGSTVSAMNDYLLINFNGKDAIEYAKSQLGTSLIEKGSGLTIDDLRNLFVNLGLSDFALDSWINYCENNSWMIGGYGSDGTNNRIIYVYK